MPCVRPGRSAARWTATLAVLFAAAAACSTGSRSGLPEAPVILRDTTRPPGEAPPPWSIDEVAPAPEVSLDIGQPVRIALARGERRVAISGTGDWRLYDSGGESTLLRAGAGEMWAVEAQRGALHAVGIEILAVHGMRVEQQIVEGKREERKGMRAQRVLGRVGGPGGGMERDRDIHGGGLS
jgi:hypothetical protein